MLAHQIHSAADSFQGKSAGLAIHMVSHGEPSSIVCGITNARVRLAEFHPARSDEPLVILLVASKRFQKEWLERSAKCAGLLKVLLPKCVIVNQLMESPTRQQA